MNRSYVPYLLVWVLVVAVFAVGTNSMSKPATGDFTIISSDGLAFKIPPKNDNSTPLSVSLNLTGTYELIGQNGNMVKLKITGGIVNVSGNIYTVTQGRGVYHPGIGKIVVTAHTSVGPGEKGQNLKLYGDVPNAGYYYSSIVGSHSLIFKKPQSKLSAAYFLAASGNFELT